MWQRGKGEVDGARALTSTPSGRTRDDGRLRGLMNLRGGKIPVSDGSVPAVAETGPRFFTNDSAAALPLDAAAAAVASDRQCARPPGT